MPTSTMRRAHDEAMGDDGPTLPGKPVRRIFTAEYKLAMIDAYEACTGTGEKGALLRREGLYSSHVVEWRRARDVGALRELAPRSRPVKRTAEQVEIDRLRRHRRNERLENDLAKHKLALEIQGKASELLERLLAESDMEKRQQP